jgi:hypothetical protein
MGIESTFGMDENGVLHMSVRVVRADDAAKKPVALEDLSLAAFGANAGGVEGGDSDQYGIEEAARLYGVPDPSKG